MTHKEFQFKSKMGFDWFIIDEPFFIKDDYLISFIYHNHRKIIAEGTPVGVVSKDLYKTLIKYFPESMI